MLSKFKVSRHQVVIQSDAIASSNLPSMRAKKVGTLVTSLYVFYSVTIINVNACNRCMLACKVAQAYRLRVREKLNTIRIAIIRLIRTAITIGIAI